MGLLALPGLSQNGGGSRGLPPGILPLPAGQVNLGGSARTLHDLTEQTVRFLSVQRVTDLKNMLSELG